MAKSIRVIPATVRPVGASAQTGAAKRRVAAYARVSTDSDEQFTSYQAQIDYYEGFIKRNPAWEFVRVYSDEGISGTSTKGREGFKAMVADALAGGIDLIVTKSISRFARNTVDTLVTIRQLRDAGVEVFFEKENVYTFDLKCELLVTIMGSIAQEESRNISQNVTWGQRKRFSDGRYSMPYKRFLGYRKGPDGLPEVVPEEAETVREIYALFLGGDTPTGIAKRLMEKGVKSPGGTAKWTATAIKSILTNEKYKGDALLQKSFTVDYLQHRTKKNDGEVEQYYLEGSHEAIVDPSEWELAQEETKRRGSLGMAYRGAGAFSGRLVCADCGSPYGPKLWHSTDPYAKTVWQCNRKYRNEERCRTPHLSEDQVKAAFVRAYNSLSSNRAAVMADFALILSAIEDPESLQPGIDEAIAECGVVEAATRDLIRRNATVGVKIADYDAEYSRLKERFDAAKARLDSLRERQSSAMARRKAAEAFLAGFEKAPRILDGWDRGLWCLTVETVLVHRDGTLEFRFRNGATRKEKTR